MDHLKFYVSVAFFWNIQKPLSKASGLIYKPCYKQTQSMFIHLIAFILVYICMIQHLQKYFHKITCYLISFYYLRNSYKPTFQEPQGYNFIN